MGQTVYTYELRSLLSILIVHYLIKAFPWPQYKTQSKFKILCMSIGEKITLTQKWPLFWVTSPIIVLQSGEYNKWPRHLFCHFYMFLCCTSPCMAGLLSNLQKWSLVLLVFRPLRPRSPFPLRRKQQCPPWPHLSFCALLTQQQFDSLGRSELYSKAEFMLKEEDRRAVGHAHVLGRVHVVLFPSLVARRVESSAWPRFPTLWLQLQT